MKTNKSIAIHNKEILTVEFFTNPRRATMMGKMYKPLMSQPTSEEKNISGLPPATTYANEAHNNNSIPITRYFFMKFI